jgi:hypothetical protein
MKKYYFLFIAALMTACGSVKVSYDFDKTANFSKYKTYAYSAESMKLGLSDLNRDRLFAAIDAELTARGMTKSESPDALIELVVTTKEQKQATSTNTGGGFYGRYGYGGGYGGITTTTVSTYVDGTLIINLVDSAIEKVVWQGRGTKTLEESASPAQREKNINYAVKTIFSKYPVKPIAKK